MQKFNSGKRKFIKKAVITSSFVVPTIMTFAVKDLYACRSDSTVEDDGGTLCSGWGENYNGNDDGGCWGGNCNGNDDGGLW